MEVFEIKKGSLHRQPSTGPMPGYTRIPYVLSIVGLVLLTSGALLALHFWIGYKNITRNKFSPRSTAEMYYDNQCHQDYCNSKDCVSMASRILELMNPEANPCEDFYEFACGGYSEESGIPYGYLSYAAADEAQLSILNDIRNIMESPLSENGTQTLRKLKQLYSSCINLDKRDMDQHKSLTDWFSDNILSYDDRHPSRSTVLLGMYGSWSKLAARLEEYNIHAIVTPSFKGSSTTPIETIEIDCNVPFFPPYVYLNRSDPQNGYILSMYKELMNTALKTLLDNENIKEEFIEDVITMETDIATVIQSSGTAHDPLLSIEHIQQIKELWRNVFGDSVQEAEVVSVCHYNLENVFLALNRADTRLSTRYVAWKMLLQLLPYLGREVRDLRLHLMSKFPGWIHAFEGTWQECSDLVRQELGLAAFQELVISGHIQKSAIQEIKGYFIEVKREFLLTFRSIQWATPLIKKLFLHKMKYMKLDLGYREFGNETDAVDIIHHDLEFGDNFFHNMLSLKKFKTRHYFQRLWYGNPSNPISLISLEDNPLGTSSNYDYKTNTVRINLGLIRSPLMMYDNDLSKYLMFGELALFAKEISHAFDATGCYYDGKGKRWAKDWWPSTLSEKYNFYTACVRDQVPKTSASNDTIMNTMNEMISDIGSFIVLFEGLAAYLETVKHAPLLPGLPFTKKQLFFIRVAQSYCQLKKHSEKGILTPKFRVNNAASNSKDFSDVFNCSKRSTLNPERKCNLLN